MNNEQTIAQTIAQKLNAQLAKSDVQVCNYARRYIIKRGSKMVVRGNCLYVNGKGAAFIAGSFAAYPA